jgi:membrane associated rhomboid family serine protease
MLPIRDENPSRIFPLVNWLIIASCALVFLWAFSGGPYRFERIIEAYGLSPSRVMRGAALHTFFTSIFLHGDLIHLLGNMLYLYIFGDNVEDMCGHLRYAAFYLLCGVFASLAHILTNWGSAIPAIGASGAISGVLGAYVVLFPKVRILTAIPFGPFIRVAYVPAYLVIGLWFVYQFLLAFFAVGSGVAYWAHVGGFLSGLALAKVFAKRRHRHPLYIEWIIS